MALAIGATPATPGHQYGGASTITTSSFSPASGSLLVAVMPWNNSGSTFLHIKTSGAEQFNIDWSSDAGAGFPSVKIASLVLGTGGAQTVTATWSNGAVGSAYLFLYEVTGAAASAFDAHADQDGGIGATSLTSSSFNLAQNDEIIFTGLHVYNSGPTVTAPSGFTGTSYTSDNDKGYSAYMITAAGGSGLTETWNLGAGASRCEMAVATYKAASGGGGGGFFGTPINAIRAGWGNV